MGGVFGNFGGFGGVLMGGGGVLLMLGSMGNVVGLL